MFHAVLLTEQKRDLLKSSGQASPRQGLCVWAVSSTAPFPEQTSRLCPVTAVLDMVVGGEGVGWSPMVGCRKLGRASA